MTNAKTKFIALLGLLVLFGLIAPPSTQAQEFLRIGAACETDAQCLTDRCQQSSLKSKICVCQTELDCENNYVSALGEKWECQTTGMAQSHHLAFCQSDKRVAMPMTDARVEQELAELAKEGKTEAEQVLQLPAPELAIQFPTLLPLEDYEAKPGESVNLPWAAKYLRAAYKYALALGAMLAVMMLCLGGVIYIVSGDKPARAGQAKTMMTGSVLGLVLLMSSYLMLNMINPQLVSFQALNIGIIAAEDLDMEYLIDPHAGSPHRGGKDIIRRLIGPYPKEELDACSEAGALWAATQLDKLKICVGPCHCAFTASRFLNYIGCDMVIDGSAGRLPFIQTQRGWGAEDINGATAIIGNPVGLLWHSGHAGVSLGKDKNGTYKDFESSGGADFRRVAQGTCPPGVDAAVKNPQLCAGCSILLPEEAPYTGRYAGAGQITDPDIRAKLNKQKNLRGGAGCEGNQGWTMGNLAGRGWKVLIRPGDSQRLGCCIINTIGKSATTKRTGSQEMCEAYIKYDKNKTLEGTWLPTPCGQAENNMEPEILEETESGGREE